MKPEESSTFALSKGKTAYSPSRWRTPGIVSAGRGPSPIERNRAVPILLAGVSCTVMPREQQLTEEHGPDAEDDPGSSANRIKKKNGSTGAGGPKKLGKTYGHALCLHPYFRDSHSGSLGLAVFPPVGLEYIVAALEPHVGKVTFLDLRLPDPLREPERLRRFIRDEIDLLCVSINWEYHFDEVCRLINSLPGNIATVVGGKQAGDCVEEIFEACPGVDVLVRGEGEQTIVDIAMGKDLRDIPGISFRENGRVIHNANRPLPEIDEYEYPDRRLRRQPYHMNVAGFALRGEEFDIILTSRGCPYKCKFCTFNLNPLGQKREYSVRSIDSVMNELRGISAGIVLIADENFFINPRRAKRICERIIEEGIQKRFLVQSRIEIFQHPDVLEVAERAGIKVFLLGIESAHDHILEQLNKGFDTAKLREAFATLRKFPFYYHGYFIYGNVGETEDEMMQIPVFARELGLDSITYQKLRIEKYSPLKELVESTPGYFIGDDSIVYSEALGRPGLKRIAKRITRDFYTPTQLYRTTRKVMSIGLLNPGSFPGVLMSLPVLLAKAVARKVSKKVRRSNFWRLVSAERTSP
ncbi:MAG: radical SAM protein [Desulfomonilaceae bacterium]|nr:radical SAM protein [Desulfomonilaceae bacterium]